MTRTCSEAALKDCCQISAVLHCESNLSLCYYCRSRTWLHGPLLVLIKWLTFCEDNRYALITSIPVIKHYGRCDMTSDGGKWMVIQRRINGSIDFYLNWTDYMSTGLGRILVWTGEHTLPHHTRGHGTED